MRNAIDRAGRAVAAASVIGVLAFAPGAASAAGVQHLAQSTTAPAATMSPGATPNATPNMATSAATGPIDAQVTRRIADLRRRLAITGAEMPKFDAFASVMRENAQQMDAFLTKRSQESSMNAVEDLKSYAALTEAHAQALQRLVSPFETLYASLSPAQQRKADTLLGRVKARAQQQTRRKAG